MLKNKIMMFNIFEFTNFNRTISQAMVYNYFKYFPKDTVRFNVLRGTNSLTAWKKVIFVNLKKKKVSHRMF